MAIADVMSKEQRRKQYEEQYPKGTVLRLLEPIDDPYTPKNVGVEFISDGVVDSMFQLHGHWSDGGSMALIIEKDKFEIVR